MASSTLANFCVLVYKSYPRGLVALILIELSVSVVRWVDFMKDPKWIFDKCAYENGLSESVMGSNRAQVPDSSSSPPIK